MKILLDMDGVVAQFNKQMFKWHNVEGSDEQVTDWNMIQKLVGKEDSAAEFYEPANHPEFWSEMELYPWVDELIEVIERYDKDWVFCSTPTLSPHSLSGKMMWIHKHFPHKIRDFVLTPRKELLARLNTVLIDDSDSNVRKFSIEGGMVITFPQPWNDMRIQEDKVNVVRHNLSLLKKLLK